MFGVVWQFTGSNVRLHVRVGPSKFILSHSREVLSHTQAPWRAESPKLRVTSKIIGLKGLHVSVEAATVSSQRHSQPDQKNRYSCE